MTPPEPHITIQGRPLTEAQAMTLRVALGHFLLDLGDGNFRRQLGEIGPLYQEHAHEIAKLMALREDATAARMARVDDSLARQLSRAMSDNARLVIEKRELLDMLEKDHRDLDMLLAEMVTLQRGFMPSQSPVWLNMEARFELLQRHGKQP